MSTAMTIPPITSRSSIFGKLPGDILRQVDQAIVNRDHTAYREIYAEHNLPDHNVSFSAFYNYARRLRAQADMLYLAESALPDMPNLVSSLPSFFALRVLDAVNDETSTHQQLHSLIDSFRIAANTRIALERHAVALPDPTAAAAKAKEQTDERAARHARLKAALAALETPGPIPTPDRATSSAMSTSPSGCPNSALSTQHSALPPANSALSTQDSALSGHLRKLADGAIARASISPSPFSISELPTPPDSIPGRFALPPLMPSRSPSPSKREVRRNRILWRRAKSTLALTPRSVSAAAP